MSDPGRNLPGFQELQLSFAAHIRNPELHPVPEGIENRRMQIYAKLFYNNIESFLANTFPVAKRIFLDPDWPGLPWRQLAREFIHRHGSESPYFLEISQEFLEFVSTHPVSIEFPWLLELLHYEWVELAIGVNDTAWPVEGYDPAGSLLGPVLISPLIWPLAYRYPVQDIGPGHLPESPPSVPTYLVVYRRSDDKVRFMASNAMTQRLLALLVEGATGEAALTQVGVELNIPSQVIREQGEAALLRLRELEILLGAVAGPDDDS